MSTSADVKIGASVLTINGNLYQGANLDHAQSPYGTGLTAEDCALFKALSEGQKEIKAMCVHVKHLVKEEGQSQVLTPQNQGCCSATHSSSQMISPRLNQSMQETSGAQSGGLLGLSSPSNNINEFNKKKNSKYRAVFQVPNGNWRNTLLLTKYQHFLLISCKSENNFVVKSTASLLPQVVIPSGLASHEIQRLNQPDLNDFRQIYDSAVYWTHLDCNEETKKEIEALLVQDDIKELRQRFSKRLGFSTPGVISAPLGGGFCRVNFITLQQLAHGISEYLCATCDRNDLANLGIVVGWDSRYDSQSLSHIMAATFKAYGIRVYCLDRQSTAPFTAFYAYKFKCIMGVFITGRDMPKDYNGAMIFGNKGQLISQEMSEAIEKSITSFINQSQYLVDMSPFFDFCSKKVRFKPDNFTDMVLKSYIQEMEDHFLLNQRKINKLCQKFVFTALYGPASEYMKKLLANFGFPNQYYADVQSSPQLGVAFPGILMPSVSKLGIMAYRQAIQIAESKCAKFVIGMDPVGESICVAEQLDEGNWQEIAPEELLCLMIEHLNAMQKQAGCTEKLVVILRNDRNAYKEIQKECIKHQIEVIEKEEEVKDGMKVLIRADIERCSFSFGQNSPYDALNAAILVAQILAGLQSQNLPEAEQLSVQEQSNVSLLNALPYSKKKQYQAIFAIQENTCSEKIQNIYQKLHEHNEGSFLQENKISLNGIKLEAITETVIKATSENSTLRKDILKLINEAFLKSEDESVPPLMFEHLYY